MLICKLLVILLMLSLLVLFTTVIINYFNKIEEFTTLYVSNFPQSEKYGITCSLCSSGQQPNSGSTGCVACPPSTAGTDGTCQQCPSGKEPSDDRTYCVDCPADKFGTNGYCQTCPLCKFDEWPTGSCGGSTNTKQCNPCPSCSATEYFTGSCWAGSSSNTKICHPCPCGQTVNSYKNGCNWGNDLLQYFEYDLGGPCGKITGDISHNNVSGWAAAASSFLIPPGRSMAIYDQVNYGGNCLSMYNLGEGHIYYNLDDQWLPYNNKVNSIRIDRGC